MPRHTDRQTLAAPAAAAALAVSLALSLAPEAAAQSPAGPPPGFEAAFDDGRINPYRDRLRARGAASSDRLWTREVPRRALPGARLAGPGKAASGPPPGYSYAFEDGRLNPARGGRGAVGEARMDRLWTQTVPRRARPGAAGSR